MPKPTSITQFEIEAKITGAIHDAMQKGAKVSDLGRKEIERLSDGVMHSFSPEARKALIHAGVTTMIRRVLGGKIAEEIWKSGLGWAIPEDEVRAIARRLKFADEADALESLAEFREAMLDMTINEVQEFPSLLRFLPLFVLQSGDATLGEIATSKSAKGDKLALSLLAWKEVA